MTMFQDYELTIPPVALALKFRDVSYHNDAAARMELELLPVGTTPATEFTNGGWSLVLWVAEEEPNQREAGIATRYALYAQEQDTDGNPYEGEGPDEDDALYFGDDDRELKVVVETVHRFVEVAKALGYTISCRTVPTVKQWLREAAREAARVCAPVEFDISGEKGWGRWFEQLASVTKDQHTHVEVTPTGPGGGNPCLVWFFGTVEDREAVKQWMLTHDWEPEDVAMYFNRGDGKKS